jgi:small-conductance mechanosensitive channel
MTIKALPPEPKLLDADMWSQMQTRFESYYALFAEWIRQNAFELMIAVLIGAIIYLILRWIKRKAAAIAAKRGRDEQFTTIAWRAVSRTKRFFRIMLAAELVNGFANAPAPVSRIILFLFTIAFVIQVAIWAREIILSLIERRAYQSGTERETLQSAMTLIKVGVSFGVFAIATIVILDNLGVNVTGLIAGLGVGGIAIGLAAQGIFSDLFAAISIIFDRPFKRGDTVTYGSGPAMTTARVEKIGMKSTRLRALTGEEKIISNSKLLEMEITNATRLDFRRTTYALSFIYQTPVEKLRALPDLMRATIEPLDADFVRCVFSQFGPGSIDLNLVFDVRTPEVDHLFESRHDIGLAVFEALRGAGYELAYPSSVSYTAAPDGTLIMPYPDESPPAKPARKA